MAQWLSDVHIDAVDVDGGSFTGGPPKILLHSTETKNRPSVYGGGSAYPHFNVTWDAEAKRLDAVQYIPLNRAARALANPPGGIQTNRDTVYQIEITGTCSPAAPKDGRLFLPEADDDFLRELGKFIRRLAEATGTPLEVAAHWAPLGSSGHATESVRFSPSEWDNFSGICGHEHCPENDHIDPGSLNVVRALELSAPKPGSAIPTIDPKPAPTHHTAAAKAPAFPLPSGHWFGPLDVNEPHNHSGYYSARDRGFIREWQAQMKHRGWDIEVDGLFGPETEKVCKEFQGQKHLGVDGLVGPITWRAAWTATITPD